MATENRVAALLFAIAEKDPVADESQKAFGDPLDITQPLTVEAVAFDGDQVGRLEDSKFAFD